MQKPKYSNFHVVVNLNDHGSASSSGLEKLRCSIEEMPKHPWLWVWLKQFKNGQRVDFTEATSHLVQRVRVRAALETQGSVNPSLHAHMVVEVEHTTMVQLSGEGLRDYFDQMLGYPSGLHIHNKFIPGQGNTKEFTLHYLSKERSCATTGAPPRRFQKMRSALDGPDSFQTESDHL